MKISIDELRKIIARVGWNDIRKEEFLAKMSVVYDFTDFVGRTLEVGPEAAELYLQLESHRIMKEVSASMDETKLREILSPVDLSTMSNDDVVHYFISYGFGKIAEEMGYSDPEGVRIGITENMRMFGKPGVTPGKTQNG